LTRTVRGLDVQMHKKRVAASLLSSRLAGEPVRVIRTFGTMMADLLALANWLAQVGCTNVAMESTGCIGSRSGTQWRRPSHSCWSTPATGRRCQGASPTSSTPSDAEWIAGLLRQGPPRSSYLPARPQRELRELIRNRTSLARELTAEANRLQKTLEGVNITLASVAARRSQGQADRSWRAGRERARYRPR
jgi:transposase